MYSDPIPVAQPVEPKRSSLGFWLLLIGGGVLLLFLTCAGIGGGVAYSFSKWMTAASEKVDAVFDDVQQGRFGSVYSTKFSTAYRKTVSPQQHADFGDLFQRGLGRLQTKSTQSMFRRTFNNDACIVGVYNGQFEKGRGTIKFTLVWEDGDWKFHELRVQSPLFEAMLKCPSCGAVHGPDAKFCPKCGRPLSSAK